MREINFLSFIAIAAATYFLMVIYQRATNCKRDKQNVFALLVLTCLAWWCVCDAFFYVADTKEEAWFWHRLGAPGWCGFIAVTAYFFYVMTGLDEKLPRPLKVMFWIPPLALVVRFMVASPTALAEDLVRSGSGLGWTYVQNFETIWPFLLIAYLIVYLGGALLHLYLWQRTERSRSIKMLAKGFVILDTIAVLVGFLSLYVIPYYTSYLPPAGCVATLIFGLWYWGRLRDYDFLYLGLALNPNYLFDSCIDAMIVSDEDYRILYANEAAKHLLGKCELRDAACVDFFDQESRMRLSDFIESESEKASNLSLRLANDLPVICSVSRIQSRDRHLRVCVLCMYEISQLKNAQYRLEYLASYDELTGLSNRRRLMKLLNDWAERAESGNEDFELLFLDLTDFKYINDTFGHSAGDAALIAVAKALRAAVSSEDVLARFAGDEFVVLHKVSGGMDMAGDLCRAVGDIDCSGFAPGVQMRVDIGGCHYSEARSPKALIRLADDRMYEDKKRSKERR